MIKKLIKYIRGIFGMKNKKETIQYYVCSLVDILGQKENLKKINNLDLQQDNLEIKTIFKNTYDITKKFRKYTKESVYFVNQIAQQQNMSAESNSNEIQQKAFSDLIVSYISLTTVANNLLQMRGIYFLLLSNCEVFLRMLTDEIPSRGGIEIGLAIQNEDNEIYGTALLNPYLLESKIAKSIRIVIGQKLYDHVEKIANSEQSSNLTIDLNIKYAKLCQEFITQDGDGEYILHYLSEKFTSMTSFHQRGKSAKDFLDKKYKELKINNQFDIANKYEAAINYFEKNGF